MVKHGTVILWGIYRNIWDKSNNHEDNMVESGFFTAVGETTLRHFWLLQVPGIICNIQYLPNYTQKSVYILYIYCIYIVITCTHLTGTPLISRSILASTIKHGDLYWTCHGIYYSLQYNNLRASKHGAFLKRCILIGNIT
jgi:hypothetical protein